jgi:acetyl esterase/lipase
MIPRHPCRLVLAFAVQLPAASSEPALKPISLWPGKPPGETQEIGEEKDMTKPSENFVGGKRLIRLGNVSQPTLTVYEPAKGQQTGAAVLVLPGGGYNILALDLEGTEVCEWLNSLGVTAVLVKYRVPKRPNVEKHAPALQDAQRALSLVRHRAKEFGIDTNRIGVLGFSAGGHLAAALSTTPTRTYTAMDAADEVLARPDFTVLIYPAYLTVKDEGDKVAPELHVTTNTPPTFITITEDDPVRMENALHYTLALKQAKVPVELHLYATGGHGYGLRRTKEMVTTWPDRVTDWMKSRDILKAR